MLLFVRAVFQIGKHHLFAGADCFIENFDGIEQLWIARQRVRYGVDVLHMSPKILAGKALQLFHQVKPLVVGDMPGGQNAVDQQPELRVREIAYQVKVGPDIALLQLAGLRVWDHAHGLRIFDLIATFHQANDITADCFPIGSHSVF